MHILGTNEVPRALLVFLLVGAQIWEYEDHVWFEDRWMVASWCDE
jgi:hypothetical protein